jgi:hypothetical protein
VVIDVQYRQSPGVPLTSLYKPNYPRLTTTTSWLSDANATLARAEAGAYTDLKYVANWNVTVGAAALMSGEGALLRDAAPASHGLAAMQAGGEPTVAQLRTVADAIRRGVRSQPSVQRLTAPVRNANGPRPPSPQ